MNVSRIPARPLADVRAATGGGEGDEGGEGDRESRGASVMKVIHVPTHPCADIRVISGYPWVSNDIQLEIR